MKTLRAFTLMLIIGSHMCSAEFNRKPLSNGGNPDDGGELEEEKVNFETDDDKLLPHELNHGPLFEKHPKDVTVIPGKLGASYSLRCSANYTYTIRVICSSQNPVHGVSPADMDVFPLSAKTVLDIVHPYSGIRTMEVEAEIGDSVLHRFHIDNQNHNLTLHCVCQAVSSKGYTTSKIATVRFSTDSSEKVSQRRTIPYGEKVLLECPVSGAIAKTPKGSEASVFWLYNGIPLVFDDNVIAEKDDLLILRTQIENEGNYTCGVKTVGPNGKTQRRLGETVSIEVKANGGWSPWGAWSECSARCSRGFRSRTRSCTNPIPYRGGKDCHGEYMEKVDCVQPRCSSSSKERKKGEDANSVSGVWSPWSPWSICSNDCKRHRQRWCTYPNERQLRKTEPVCEDKDDHMSESCSGGECKVAFIPNNQLHPSASYEQGFTGSSIGSAQIIALIIGMLLMILILCSALFVLHNRCYRRGDEAQDKGQRNLVYSTVPINSLSLLPGEHAVNFDPRQHEFITEGKLDPAVTIPLLQQLYHHPNICSVPLTPMQTRANFCTRSQTSSSTSKTTRSDSGSQHSVPYAPQSDVELIYDTIPDDGPTNDRPEPDCSSFTTSSMIGSEGGRISMEDLGVTLTIPPGAITQGKRRIFLSVLNVSRDLPSWLKDKFSVLSSVVECGPSDLSLSRPAILSFDHCANEPVKWDIHLMSCSQTGSNRNYSSWKSRASWGTNDSFSEIICKVSDDGFCHVQTDQLATFVLCGESKPNTFATKSSKLLAFLSKRRGLSQKERTLTVHCIENTKASAQSVLNSHEEDYMLVGNLKTIQLHDGGANLCVALEEQSLSDGWEMSSCVCLQEIPFKKVWSSVQGAYCAFGLLSPNTTSFSAREAALQCRVTVYQRGNQSHRQILNLNSSTGWPIYRNVIDTVATQTSVNSIDGFRLNGDSRKKIADLLDNLREDGRDWTKLAQHLGLSNIHMAFFAQKKSPTSHLLDFWEATERGPDACSKLLVLLRSLGRPDVVIATENLIGAWV